MAKFKFDIGCIFSQPVVKISSNLLPHTFLGDRRMAIQVPAEGRMSAIHILPEDVSSKVSEIIDRLGELSAIAQKLSRPITSAQKLRMSENQTVYLMADINGCDGDVVIGLLKIGTKNLYLFDSTGQTKKIDKARCILDFYIHDSRQRMGIGKILFDIMLKEESWSPVKCSVDRPSEKLIQFLKKYYGLEKIIPQANKFVLYEGFFDEDEDANRLKVMLPIHNRSSIKENNCTIQIPHNQFNKQQKFYHSSMFPPISPKQLHHQCSVKISRSKNLIYHSHELKRPEINNRSNHLLYLPPSRNCVQLALIVKQRFILFVDTIPAVNPHKVIPQFNMILLVAQLLISTLLEW